MCCLFSLHLSSKQNNFFVLFCFVLFFLGMNQRNGTDVDAANAMKVFAKFGYKVKVYNDQTVEQIKQLLTAGEYDVK